MLAEHIETHLDPDVLEDLGGLSGGRGKDSDED